MPGTTTQLIRAALIAGLAASVIEMVFVLPIQALLGHSPMLVFQSIASGVSGTAAYRGGMASALAGVGWHVLISLISAGMSKSKRLVDRKRWHGLLAIG